MSFQRGRGRGRGQTRGRSRGRGYTRGSGRGRGRGGRFIRALTNGEEEEYETNPAPLNDGDEGLGLTISTALQGVSKERRDQILQQLTEGFR